MTAELDDTHSLRARARRPAVLACALTAAVLAPLVDWLLIEEVLTNHEDPPLANVLAYPAWSPAMAGLLGGLVAIVALRDVDRAGTPSPLARVAATVGLGAVAGVLHLGLLAMASLPAEVASRGVEGLECIVGAAMLGTIGAIVSAPMGAAFGVLFVLATGPAAWCAARPSHDGPAWCWLSSAWLLVISTAIALGLLHALEGPYCQALFVVALPSVGVTLPPGSDLAWTRFWLASPLALGALVFALRSLWLHVALARFALTLRHDRHPRWKITTEPSRDAIVPLFASDRLRDTVVIVAREQLDAYRGHPRPIAAISRG